MMNFAHSFELHGHRGARGLMPENTLAAFAKALSIGVHCLELDVGTTRDGIIVVTHNPTLEPDITRDKTGNWLDEEGPAVHSLSLAELRQFDVGRLKPGTCYEEDFSSQTAVDGSRIPTLTDVLELIQRSSNKTVQLNIEMKLQPTKQGLSLSPEDFVAALLKDLRDYNFLDRAAVQSFDWRPLQILQRLAPGIPTGYLTVQQSWYDNMYAGQDEPSPWTAGYSIDQFDGNIPQMVKAAGGHTWSSYHGEVSAEKIQQAHDLGLKVKVWTVNEPEQMEALIEMDVDAIITDYPDRLRRILKTRGMAIPPATPVSV